METTLNIKIKTAEKLPVLLEEGDSWDEYTQEQKKECEELRAYFAENVHAAFVRWFKDVLFEEQVLEYVMEDSDTSVEGWEDLKDYRTKFVVTKAPKVKP